ncbi:MAG: HD domain-containing protein [Candidatus Schekmanbacteria bacterium]|nr:HD domain-containing protein [Candidatus Schekmanbacteria bacterium]
MARNIDLIKEPNKRKYNMLFNEFISMDYSHPAISAAREKPAIAYSDANVIYNKAVKVIEDISPQVENDFAKVDLKIHDTKDIITSIVNSLQSCDCLLPLSLHSTEKKHNLACHMVNVSILSIKVAMGINLPPDDLVKIGLAAVFHDLGKLKVPQQIINAPHKVSPEEYEEIKKHSVYGYNIISSWRNEYNKLAEIVLNVHEREDGSGYPNGYCKGKIHQHSQIIGIVDVYEALTHHRPHRARVLHFEAMRLILTEYKAAFPKCLLKTLLQQLSAYPLGSFVKLNSTEIAQVIQTNSLSPLRPVVKIVCDSQGKRPANPQIYNLAENSLLFVISSLFEENFMV